MRKLNWYWIFATPFVMCLVSSFWLAVFSGPWMITLLASIPFAAGITILLMQEAAGERRQMEADMQAFGLNDPNVKTRSQAQVSERQPEEPALHPYPGEDFLEDNLRY